MKVLVVDDDLTTRIVLEEVMSAYAEVDTYMDGDQAVLAYRRELGRGQCLFPIQRRA